MHNLQKIKVFRVLLYITYPISVIFLLPLAWLKKKNPTGSFFFFDRYVIGGAQRVHLDILESINDMYKQVYFTRLSPNNKLKQDFYSLPNACVKDIHFYCDNLLLRLFTVHYYAFYINRHRKAHVFSSNSTFFYDMLPFINSKAIKTELLHNFTYGNNGMEFFGLANYRNLTNRMVIDAATYQNIISQYKEYNIPPEYVNNIHLIEPGVPVPPEAEKATPTPLKVLYAGRGGAQKRIYLLNRIAEYCIQYNWPVEFHFAGTMMDELSELTKSNSRIHGEISGQKAMYSLYEECHAILMTSAYEGFPMLIKEGMACGCIPVVTALEGNKTHLKHLENSLLINHPEDEENVVKQGLEHLQYLIQHPEQVKLLAGKAYQHALHYFNREAFIEKYRAFLVS